MAWIAETFDGAKLPIHNAESDYSTPTVSSAYVTVIGSLWDTLGNATARPSSAQQFQIRGVYAGLLSGINGEGLLAKEDGGLIITAVTNGSPLLVFDPATEAEAEYDALAAKLGKRGVLLVRNPVTGATRSRTARLLRLERIQRPALRTTLIECAALFEAGDLAWT